MQTPTVFHIGPQKTGTTWLYRCSAEHPELFCHSADSISYFDMNFHRGAGWYNSLFEGNPGKTAVDFSPSYIRSPQTPERIAGFCPNAHIVFTLRNPIDRAFSHYWHEKKKGKISFEFVEVLKNYDLFSSWIEPGMYALHLKRYLNFFPIERIAFVEFDQISKDSDGVLQSFFELCSVRDARFQPRTKDKKVNAAGNQRSVSGQTANALLRTGERVLGQHWRSSRIGNSLHSVGRNEYIKGVPKDLRSRLTEILIDDIESTEKLLAVDLSDWKDVAS